MSKFKTFTGIMAVLVTVGVGIGIGYLIWGYRGGGGAPVSEWRVSQKTAGRTAEKLSAYKRRIAELEEAAEERDAELLAAVQADFVAPAETVVYKAEVKDQTLEWEWLERGGGTGLADFARRDVTMNWNDWRFAVDVELTRERDGRLGATVSTDEPGLVLAETRFYADDPWKEKWYEKFEAGLAGGYGDGFTAQAHFGWGGWAVYAQRSGLFEPERGNTTVMFGKEARFF